MRTRALVVAVGAVSVLLTGCFDCGSWFGERGGRGGTGGGSGASSSRTVSYALVEASGQVGVTGHLSTCDRQTTSSVVRFGMPRTPHGVGAATYSVSDGTLSLFANISQTIEARQGTDDCSTTGTRNACPSSTDTPQTFDGLLMMTEQRPAVGYRLPAPSVVVPVLRLPMPELCDNLLYEVAQTAFEAHALSAQQLASGRFVLEGEGRTPIALVPPDEGTSDETLTGAYEWQYRFVFEALDGGVPSVEAPELATWSQCTLDEEPTAETLLAAIDLYADGGTTLPVNASGCRRVVISNSGTTTTTTHFVNRGTRYQVDDAGVVTTAADERATYVREVSEGRVRDRMDMDNDWHFESSTEWTYDSTGAWVKEVGEVVDPATSQVVVRVTTTPVDSAMVHVVFERAIAGTLQEEREATVSRVQTKCFNGTGGGAGGGSGAGGGGGGGGVSSIKPCTPAQKRRITERLARITKRGDDCLKKSGLKSFDYEGKGVTLVATEKLILMCDSNPQGDLGSLDPEPNRNGEYTLTVNVARTGPNAQAEFDSTLFHELLHADWRFHHDDDLVTAAAAAGKLLMADRTYACEAMCYGGKGVDACMCIRCLDPAVSEVLDKDICTTCESKFGSTESCRTRYEKGPDGQSHAVASAVAAWCKGNKVLCDTKAECDSQCGAGCMPIRATCDDKCN